MDVGTGEAKRVKQPVMQRVDVEARHDRVWRAPAATALVALVAVGLAWPAPRAGSLPLALMLAAVGVVAVGPVLAYAVCHWVGWRVVLPLFVDPVPTRRQLGRVVARCAGCDRPAGRLAHVALTWSVRVGRCRGCGMAVPAWVAGVELATGALFALAGWRLGWGWRLAPVLVLVAGLVAIAAVDVVHQRIPTRFVALTASVGAVVGGAVTVLADVGAGMLLAAGVGSVAYGGFMTLIYLASPDGVGGGDVRLAWLVGGVVGGVTWGSGQSATAAVSAVMTTVVVAAVIGLATHVLVALRGRARRTLPFGPAMGAAALLVVVLWQPT